MHCAKIYVLRVIHGLFAAYFLWCLFYIYYAAATSRIDTFLFVAMISLAGEGVAVFVLNKGDCPLIHIQRWVGDETPFFALFLPPNIAKRAIPFFAMLTWVAVALLALRFFVNILMR